MVQLVLTVFASGFDAIARSKVENELRRCGPTYISWQWADAERADVVIQAVGAPAPRAASSTAAQVLATWLPDEDPLLAMQALIATPSAVVLCPGAHMTPSLGELARRHGDLLRQQAIGWALANEHEQIESGAGAYHLVSPDEARTLLAVIDMGRFLALFSPRVNVDELLGATWLAKPAADSRVSLGFAGASLHSCMWHFALRSGDILLPSRYQTRMIFAKRGSSPGSDLLWSEHVEVLELLRDEPRTLDQLVLDTGWAQPRLAKVLEGLYLAGTISTRARAAFGGVVSFGPSSGLTLPSS